MTRSLNKYNFAVKNCLITKNNLYNSCILNSRFQINLVSVFNTFGSEKNIKLVKLYLILFYLTNQKPFIKKVKFNYIKKKILKRFFLIVNLNLKNQFNLLSYLINFYNYFFQVYYQKNLKYNYFNSKLVLYLDNLQLFFKNYNRQNHKTQIKIIIMPPSNSKGSIFYQLLNNMFLLKIKN